MDIFEKTLKQKLKTKREEIIVKLKEKDDLKESRLKAKNNTVIND